MPRFRVIDNSESARNVTATVFCDADIDLLSRHLKHSMSVLVCVLFDKQAVDPK